MNSSNSTRIYSNQCHENFFSCEGTWNDQMVITVSISVDCVWIPWWNCSSLGCQIPHIYRTQSCRDNIEFFFLKKLRRAFLKCVAWQSKFIFMPLKLTLNKHENKAKKLHGWLKFKNVISIISFQLVPMNLELSISKAFLKNSSKLIRLWWSVNQRNLFC